MRYKQTKGQEIPARYTFTNLTLCRIMNILILVGFDEKVAKWGNKDDGFLLLFLSDFHNKGEITKDKKIVLSMELKSE